MKYIVISDIHGSAAALRQALSGYEIHDADGIVLLGDLLYHGPRNDLPEGYAPKETIALLHEWQSCIVATVRGNCDAEVDQMVLPFLTLTESVLWKPDGNHTFLLAHGHHVDQQLQACSRPPFAILSGHTHIPTAGLKHDIYYLNPGSISIPKGGFPPSYGLLNERSFQVCDLNDHLPFLAVIWD